jgi:hypothetical protein
MHLRILSQGYVGLTRMSDPLKRPRTYLLPQALFCGATVLAYANANDRVFFFCNCTFCKYTTLSFVLKCVQGSETLTSAT